MLKIKGANLVAQPPPMFNVKVNSFINCSTFERVNDKVTKMTSRQPVDAEFGCNMHRWSLSIVSLASSDNTKQNLSDNNMACLGSISLYCSRHISQIRREKKLRFSHLVMYP